MSKIIIKSSIRYWGLVPRQDQPREIETEGDQSQVLSEGTAYGKYAAEHGIGGPLENADQDKLLNIEEFLMGGNPTATDYLGVISFVGYDPERFLLYFQFHTGIEGGSIHFEVGNGKTWRRAEPSDLLKTDGLNFAPVTDEADLALVVSGMNAYKHPFLKSSPSILKNVHPARTGPGGPVAEFGFIRPVFTYEW